jgi:deoxyribodipyrimidine photo-lyase
MIRRNSWPSCLSDPYLSALSGEFDIAKEPDDTMSIAKPRILIYILRRDLRLSDNPIFHRASLSPTKRSSKSNVREREDSHTSDSDNLNFTHLLPVYVFPANQVEVSGFLPSPTLRSPYLEARSRVAGLWRTGPHRAKFTAEGVWGLKEKLEELECGSGLEVRVGMIGEVVKHMLEWYSEGKREERGSRADIAGIWMTNEDGTEEKQVEAEVKSVATENGVAFKLWDDVKYYIDECVLPLLPHWIVARNHQLTALQPRSTVRPHKRPTECLHLISQIT